MDGDSFSSCANTNPATINLDNVESGQEHTFEVRAVDTQGNKDPNPDSFSWTILTPMQAIQKLVDTIDSMNFYKGTAASLKAPLNAAIRQLNHNHNEIDSCNTLDAFLHQVNKGS